MKPTRRSMKEAAKSPVIEVIDDDGQIEAMNGSERQSSIDKEFLEVKQDLYEDSENEELNTRDWITKHKATKMDEEADRLARTVVCMNLAPKVHSKHLKELFASAGETKMIICAKGTAFVEFVDQEAVAKALALSGSKVLGKPIVCQPSEAQEDDEEQEESMEIEEVTPLANKTSASAQESETFSSGVETSQGTHTLIHSHSYSSMENEATSVNMKEYDNKPNKVVQEENIPKNWITPPEKTKKETTKSLENAKSLQKKNTDTRASSRGQIKSNHKNQIAGNRSQSNHSQQRKKDSRGGHNITIYVGNLLFGKVTETMIRNAFKGFGCIVQIQDFNSSASMKPLGFMYITYKHQNEGLAAIKKMDGTIMANRRMKVSEKTSGRPDPLRELERTLGMKRPGDPLPDVRTKLSRPNPLMKGVAGYEHPQKRQEVANRVVWETDARNTIQERLMTEEYQREHDKEREQQRYKSELRKYHEDLLLWERAEEQRRMEEASRGGSREDRYGYETVRREPEITAEDERALASVTARAALAGSILQSLFPNEGQDVQQIPSASSVIYEQGVSRHGRDQRHSSSQREDLRDNLAMTIPGHRAGSNSIIDDRSRVQTLRTDMMSELALIQHGHSSDSRDLRSGLSRHILPKNGDPYQQASHRSAHYSMVDDRDLSVNQLSQCSSSRRSPVMPTRSHHRLHSTERKAYASEEALPRSFSPPRALHDIVKRPATTDYFHHLVPPNHGTNTLRVDSAAAILQNQNSYNSISALKSSRDRGYHNLTSRSSLESVLQDQDPRYHAFSERSSSSLNYPSSQNICRGWYCVDGMRIPANTSWNQYEDIINLLERGQRVLLQVELSATKCDPIVARFMLKVACGNPWVYNSVTQLWESQATDIGSGRVY